MQVIPQLNYRFDTPESLARHISPIDTLLMLWCRVRQLPAERLRVSVMLPDGLAPFNGKLVVGSSLVGIDGHCLVGLIIDEQEALLRLRCMALIQPYRQICGTILTQLF
ncbi:MULTISPECIES: hypothetical protein [unclassified Idiomarina]|uniref:hypothetical protein n=1 Tax=unclassified Idiomarina TaxID=2614829 RepID=UPI000C9379EC|nr:MULTISPECIES: hypothetical protein [unclassified Idiomarina]MAD54509.1 hypothetical protein [Idiomarinaceae bacterium]MEC7643191.1 hypothetical protein [Pseudomonadota bacterium]MEC9319507.1 hypothetical protein [Pseudomonadota bacterium]NQZ04927.1 hypothetical protein [Idiomarina sp.]|tara:strand:+ start:642 stop:968 length:327 start_codon:yes stop_codon:yes gene_type:complete